jgi:adenine-specific DNA-methyltransferase
MAAIHELLKQVQDPALRARLTEEFDRATQHKKFGLVFEEHMPECTPLYGVGIKRGGTVAKKANKINETYTVIRVNGDTAVCRNKNTGEAEEIAVSELVAVAEFGDPIFPCLQPIDKVENAPDSDLWHTLIEADNYHALQLLEYLYAGKVDCIYIDPPYNTGAKDWKYNNDYVDGSDSYRHSKWLSMMKKRLKLAKRLLNPEDSVLIVTIDEKEYLHLGCLLEEMFPEANIQMVTDVINPGGTNREKEFSRVEEYLFICRFGDSSVIKHINNMLGNTDEVNKSRVWYSFCRGNNLRYNHNRQFFPIYIDVSQKKIIEVGDAGDLTMSQADFPSKDGLVAVFPVNANGEEASWRGIPNTIRDWVKKGYVRVSNYDKKNNRWTFAYIPSGLQERIESGEIKATKKRKDGSLDIERIDPSLELVSPRTVWIKKEHNATDYGASLIKQLVPGRYFAYPKSLYSVADALRFFVTKNKNALIVDFFAGSGTTLHAVNLLNAEDGGHRRCILVTNNEVSADEAKVLTVQGYKPGDPEWDALGIARYVTWPRTVCSIEGHDVNGNPLNGNYIGSDRPMADGFPANCEYFKLDFLDRDLVSLGRQFQEILPLLWMKSGAIGKRPEIGEEEPTMLVLPENHFAVLVEETAYAAFAKEVRKYDTIDTVYFVTNSESAYHEMSADLGVNNTYQMYRDYIDNFMIGARRDRT